jgi:hypothetical protein
LYFVRLETLVNVEAVQINYFILLVLLFALLSLQHFIIPSRFKQDIAALIILFFIVIYLSRVNL